MKGELVQSTKRYDLKEKLLEYFGGNYGYTSKIPDAGLVVFDALYQPPLLVGPEWMKRGNLLKRLVKVTDIPNAYYGIGGERVSYRCLLIPLALKEYSERIREMTGRTPETIIYDAYTYDLVNRFTRGVVESQNVNPDSPDLVDWILDRLIRMSEIYDVMCVSRNKKRTLGAMSKITGVDTTYISAVDFYRNPVYRETFRKLLEEARDEKFRKRWYSLIPRKYLSDDSLAYLYVPMEISEALTLIELKGIGVKIGDTKERGFDQLIAERSYEYLFGYTMPAITPGGNQPPYRNPYDIDFWMSDSKVEDFLRTSPTDTLRQFEFILMALGRLQPTLERSPEEVIKGTIEVFSEIKGEIDEKI